MVSQNSPPIKQPGWHFKTKKWARGELQHLPWGVLYTVHMHVIWTYNSAMKNLTASEQPRPCSKVAMVLQTKWHPTQCSAHWPTHHNGNCNWPMCINDTQVRIFAKTPRQQAISGSRSVVFSFQPKETQELVTESSNLFGGIYCRNLFMWVAPLNITWIGVFQLVCCFSTFLREIFALPKNGPWKGFDLRMLGWPGIDKSLIT